MKKLFFGLLAWTLAIATFAQVKVFEGQETIPTYVWGPDEVSPIFYTGRGVQGAAGHMYPYPAQTTLGDTLTMVNYNMVYLENEYLKVTILPQFGGKLFSAIDKTNGREMFHRNSTIKPDLIGTLGAWISGGIEWCFPHHHRTTTLMPADYSMVENKDGSATVWIGETEKSLGLRGVIGITLHPGCSYIEAEYRLNNPNEIVRNFLFWANVAITADENWRTFWPPSQEIGVFHSNTSFTHWPISHEVYRGIDYSSGVDLTWWKNHPDPVSFFFWQGKEGFVGGYDYAKRAGTIHVGDVVENKTSKLWQFGPGLQGQNARRKLTDDGKAYVELMTGTFSNNQPGYSWFAPHAVKSASNYWYPVRDLEIVKSATLDASATLQMRDEKNVYYGFNTTRSFKNANVLLRNGDEILHREVVDIDPATPYTSLYEGRTILDEYQLYIELTDAEGNILVSYRPHKPTYPELPEVQDRPEAPVKIESVEDLYLTGRFVEQFSRPGSNPDDYYLKALEISPNDYRVCIALGLRRLRQWQYKEAESYLQKAADKLQVDYFQPREGELFYYLGLAQQALGEVEKSYQNFARSTWYHEWMGPGYFQLARIKSKKGDFRKALNYAAKAHSANNLDGNISILYSALLRRSGQNEKALEVINQLIDHDPINFSALFERELLKGRHSMEAWHRYMQDVDNNYLEIAGNYLNAGMLDEAEALFSNLGKTDNPIIDYYQVWLYNLRGNAEKTREHLMAAHRGSVDFCFPYRPETLGILEHIANLDPLDSKAYYLIGNLLYDRRPADAIKAWEKARELDTDFGMVWRNLAFGAFYHENDVKKAIDLMRKAVEIDANHPIWYAELENYFDQSDLDFSECLEILSANLDVVKKDITAPKSLVKLYNLNGDYDKAIDLLKTHHFRTWEGGRGIYFHYVDAYVLKAKDLISKGNSNEATGYLQKALEYPENLEVGKPLDDERNAMIYYYLGLAHENLRNGEKANGYFKTSVQARNAHSWPDLIYYQARSYEKLGEDIQAESLYNELIERGNKLLDRGISGPGIGVEEQTETGNKDLSTAYYLKALGALGLHEPDQAKMFFDKAITIYPNNLWAKIHLQSISDQAKDR
ncbi:MAG: DUF5107 domain-containing protein [Saprospiraceae bacterium]|nr:DUF5107 domain-containing protein [Saprospiraceae bacterium]